MDFRLNCYMLAFTLVIFPLSDAYSQDELNKHYINFIAGEGKLGHAFVLFFYESEEEQMTVYDGTWGFYPKDGKGIFHGPGEIRDDYPRQSNAIHWLRLSISKEQYYKALAVKTTWENKEYTLTKSDCVSFITEVAQALGDIDIPDRAYLENFPVSFLGKLIELNK